MNYTYTNEDLNVTIECTNLMDYIQTKVVFENLQPDQEEDLIESLSISPRLIK